MSRIGDGGMGTVWLGRRSDGRYEGQVAIKLLNAALVGRDGEERFRREGVILGRLSHPHIARLIDAGVSNTGQPYLVLELVKGDHIDAYCDERRLSIPRRVRLFLDVLSAVSHAHTNLIVHRDLKPSNVLIDDAGAVKLLDFSIAKLMHDEDVSRLTQEGGAVLTPRYAAPEQVTGGPITTATDVYSLGVLLYELLSGQHPYGGAITSSVDFTRAIVEREPLPLSTAFHHASQESRSLVAAQRGSTPERLERALGSRTGNDPSQDAEEIAGGALRVGRGAGRRSAAVSRRQADHGASRHGALSCREVCQAASPRHRRHRGCAHHRRLALGGVRDAADDGARRPAAAGGEGKTGERAADQRPAQRRSVSRS